MGEAAPAWGVAAVLVKLCEWCGVRPIEKRVNLPGNWLPTQVCTTCLHGDADEGVYDAATDEGWREMCPDCNGTGDPTGEGLYQCETCDGEGDLDG